MIRKRSFWAGVIAVAAAAGLVVGLAVSLGSKNVAARGGLTGQLTSTPLPADAWVNHPAGLGPVVCSTASTCIAAGYYTDRSGVTQGLILEYSNSRWKSYRVPQPAGTYNLPYLTVQPNLSLDPGEVECPGISECVALGTYLAAAYGPQAEALLVTGYGASWTATPAPLPAGPSPATVLVSNPFRALRRRNAWRWGSTSNLPPWAGRGRR